MPEAMVKAAEGAVAATSHRNRNVVIAVLVAVGLFLLYRCVHRGNDSRGGDAPGESKKLDANETSLKDDAASAVRAAAAKYSNEYQERMARMAAPKEEEHARPFIGFSLADNLRPDCLVVDGVFEDGPASQVGVDVDHVLLAVAGEEVSDIETVRGLTAKHCKPGHITHFVFADEDGSRYEADVWVMTADEQFRGKPYFFSPQDHNVRQSDRLKQTWRPGQVPFDTDSQN